LALRQRFDIQKIKWKRDIVRSPSNRYPTVLKIELQRASPFKKSNTADKVKMQNKPIKSKSFQRSDDRRYCFLGFSLDLSDFMCVLSSAV
jgi:hypothetical protein